MKFLLATVALAVLALATPASADNTIICPPGTTCIVPSNPAPATPAPIPTPIPTLPPVETWWIYNWVHCFNDSGDCVVTITVDGLNAG
jgi:hypothetical protein